MSMAPLDLLTAALLLGALWSVACRMARMDPARTLRHVVWGHWLLGVGLLAALLLPQPVAKVILAGGVAAYLLSGSHAWRYAQPADTTDSEEAA